MALGDFISLPNVQPLPDYGAQVTQMLDQATQAAQQQQQQQVHQPSKLRNFLGAIGDAISVGSGGQPFYHQRMMQQRMQGALQGFLTNPDQAISALMQVDAPSAIDLYKAVHPASETPLELKLLQHLKEHPEDASALHQIDSELHPGMMAPVTLGTNDTVDPGTSTLPHVTDQKSYDAVAAGSQYVTPDGHIRLKGGQPATPAATFPGR